MIRVSVIIPVYNVENYLKRCVDSILDQTYKNIEIIIVNDGSTDRSLEICEIYHKNYNNIKLINKENGGLSSARNEGIRYSNGDYLLFLDSDDYFDSSLYVEKLVKDAKDNDADLVIFGMKKLYDINDFKLVPVHGQYNKKQSKNSLVNNLMRNDAYKSRACTKLIKKDIIIKNNIFFIDKIRSEDIEWSLHILICSKKIIVNKEVYYVYQQNRKNSITSSFTLDDFQNYIDIIKRSCLNIDLSENKLINYYSYLGYQYSILLGYSNSILREFPEKITLLKKYSFLLMYGLDKKTKLVCFLSKIMGLKNTIKILGEFLKTKKMEN